MRHILFITMILLLSASKCYAQDEHAHDISETTLIVKVVNESANGTDVVGDTVTVDFYRHGEVVGHVEGLVGEDGRAVFTNAPAGTHVVAVASTKHADMAFSSHTVEVAKTDRPIYVNISAYDVSYDNSVLRIETHHMIFKTEADSLVVTEYMQFVNPTDRAVTTDEKDAEGMPKVLSMKLPAGFSDLSVTSYFVMSAIVQTEEGFYDTMAMPPGEFQAIFNYKLPITASDVAIAKPVTMPTEDFTVFSQIGSVKIVGLEVPAEEFVTGDGSTSEYFALGNVTPPEVVKFKITGFNYSKPMKDTVIPIAVIFGVLAILVIKRQLGSKPKPASRD